MTSTIKLRRGTAALWTERNPILAEGEPGLETDTQKIKFGDGTTRWNDLDYLLATDLEDLEAAIATLGESIAEVDAVSETVSDLSDTVAETADTQDSMLDDLTRKFRLLLKAWLVEGLPPPAGLEDDYETALETE